jgi:hypothetical protein
MRIAILYHSQTGHTQDMAKLIETKLIKAGHEVRTTQLQTNIPQKGGSIRQPMDFEIVNLPDISGFDAIIVGGPVWAFGPSTVVYKALTLMKDLKGKKLLPFVTMGFPLKGMGGKTAIGYMGAVAMANGATVLSGIIIPKMFHNFELLMEKGAESCVNLITH